MWSQKPNFRFEIDKFSEKEAVIASHAFVNGGCEWYLNVWPKGRRFVGDHFSVLLYVANQKSLGTGWKRKASYYYVVLNQSGKELYKSSVELNKVFRAESPGCGFQKTLPLPKFKEKGCLENDRLIIEFYVKVVEAVDGDDADGSRAQKVEESVKNRELMDLGSLKSKLEELFLEKKKADADRSRVQQLEESVKNLELMDLGSLKSKLGELFLEEKKKADAYRSRVQQLEESVKNLEMMVSDLKVKLDKEGAKFSSDDGFLLI